MDTLDIILSNVFVEMLCREDGSHQLMMQGDALGCVTLEGLLPLLIADGALAGRGLGTGNKCQATYSAQGNTVVVIK